MLRKKPHQKKMITFWLFDSWSNGSYEILWSHIYPRHMRARNRYIRIGVDSFQSGEVAKNFLRGGEHPYAIFILNHLTFEEIKGQQ